MAHRKRSYGVIDGVTPSKGKEMTDTRKVKITATDYLKELTMTQYRPSNEVANTVRLLKEEGYTKIVTEYHSND